jgi:ParB family chromosome partitioning protein
LLTVDVALIDPNPHQPRAAMDPVALRELAASIKASGLLQPIILRPSEGGRYQLVAGHRRTEAAKLAGFQVVQAIVRDDSTDERQAEWALVENIQRQDLNAIERAKAYRRYVDTFLLTHAQAAERLGEDRTTISNFLRLLDLNPGVQDLVSRGILSAGHAKVLAGVTDPAMQDALANRAVTEGLSVRKLEEAVNAPPAVISAGEGGPEMTEVAGHTRTLAAKSPHVIELEQDLSRKLGTKLRIFPSKKKNTGKIMIQYFSLDEFDRIVERFN